MLRQASLLLCSSVAALLAIGLTTLASTSVWVHGHEEPYFFLIHQARMAVAGLVLAIVAAWVSPEWLRKHSLWMLAGVCILLALCFAPVVGVDTYGSKRWVQFPGLPQFQPSEIAKLVTVIALAAWFARWQTEVHSFWRGFVMPGILAGVPLLLIAAETDVGTALTLAMVVAGLLFCMGTRLRYLIPTALLAITGALYYIYNNEVRWSRVVAWLDLENPIYQADKGMQQWRSLLALGNGGPWGVGLGNGIEKFGTLTFAHIDFIFPVIGEELGLPATLGVVLCFVLIAVAGIGIAVQATQVFNRCLALGITCLIVVPSIQNIAVTTAVLPNDGLPLPFVSYGGTSLVFSLAAVGLLVGIHRRSQCAAPQEFPLSRKTRLAVRL
ncbi:MAG: cell division protein FtsW [Verrucomicrobia bacterium]|nr:MAG: cell division protein FtsW [Verrucomicrobiota bacterium]